MRHYFDASVIGTLVLRDADWLATRAWIADTAPGLVYSDFGLGELASAIGRRVRMQQIDAEDGLKVMADLTTLFATWSRIEVAPSDIDAAIGYVSRFELGLRLPDAIHIAIAGRLGCPLVTFDRLQYRAATVIGVAVINPLLQNGNQP